MNENECELSIEKKKEMIMSVACKSLTVQGFNVLFLYTQIALTENSTNKRVQQRTS